MKNTNIEYHADDYGLFPKQSREILECYQNGCLNAVSIMPNSPYLSECMEMLRPYRGKIKLAIHLNFMEGHCLCDSEQIDRLADGKGIFNRSFGTLLLAGILPGKAAYRRQLRREISAQIHAARIFLSPEMPLRIDGHAHYHMLPVVFDSMIQVIQEEKLKVEYIRFPYEKLSVYFRSWNQLRGLKPINLVKVAVLNLLAVRNRRKHSAFLAPMEKQLFLGVALSGNMTEENVNTILPRARQKAIMKNQGIELLAHPGGVYSSEDIAQLTHPDDIKFLTSRDRGKEKEMFCARQSEPT